MRLSVFALSTILLLSGCITHEVGLSRSHLVQDQMGMRQAGKMLNFKVTGTEVLQGKSAFTSQTCGAHDFVFDYRTVSRQAARDAFARSFKLSNAASATGFSAKLQFTGYRNPMHCELTILGIECTGRVDIRAKLYLEAPDGTQVMENLDQTSGKSDGTFSMLCTAPKEEGPKNYQLAFDRVIKEAIDKTDAFMGIRAGSNATQPEKQAPAEEETVDWPIF